MLTVSPAAPHTDLLAILELAEAMHPACTFADMDLSREVLGSTVLGLVDNEDGLVLVAKSDGLPVGFMLALASRSYFGYDRVASELVVFVAPQHRASSAGLRLLREYIRWAKTRNVKRINAGNSAGMNDEHYVKVLSRLGFVRSGSLMFMEV